VAQRFFKMHGTVEKPSDKSRLFFFYDVFYSRRTIAYSPLFSYAALGLTHTLNSSSGGVEPIETIFEEDDKQGKSISQNSTIGSSIPKGFGRIIRDETGQVLHIEMAEGEDEESLPDIVPDMEALQRLDEAVLEKWTKALGSTNPTAGPLNIVQGMALHFCKLW
jgi:nucleolar protein 16